MPRFNRDGQEIRGTRGAGSVFRRPDGRYAASIDVAPLPGQQAKRPRLVRLGRTAAEARAALSKALEARARQADAAAHLTVADYLAEWLRDVVAPTRRPRTVDTYTAMLRRYVVPAIGTRPLASLTPRDLQAVYATLQRAGLHATAALLHSVLHAALAYAERVDLLPRNPADRVERPKAPTPTRRRLTRAEARTLLAALPDHPDEALYLVALYTGARASELTGLRWAAVDWAAASIHLREQWQRRAGHNRPGPPKSRARVVVVPPAVLAALRRHQTRQQFVRLSAGTRWQEHGLVFPTTTGGPQAGAALLERWQRLAARLGFGHVTFHAIRHSYASLARGAGVGVEMAQEVMGHSRASLTLEVYTHVEEAQRQEAARRLAAYLEEGGG